MGGDKYQLSPMDGDHLKYWINHIFTADKYYQCFTKYSQELVATPPEIVALIVDICTKLQLSTHIEFSCIDTYDLYFCYNFEHMQKRWTMIESRGQVKPEFGWIFVKQEFLASYERNLLCLVSLVTKIFDFYPESKDTVEKLWTKMQNTESIAITLAHKELEMLKILHGKIRKSQALESIEVFLLMCVQPIWPSRTEDVLFFSIKILRIVYLNRQRIYSPLKPVLKSANDFQAFQTDKVLMGASVILSAVKLLNISSPHQDNYLLTSMAKLSNLRVKDITTLSKEMCCIAKSTFVNATENIVD